MSSKPPRLPPGFLLLVLLLSFLVTPVSAHPGRTDSNGGHYDRSTGQYHYHHGFPAHQHYDIDGNGSPDCPYNFKDLTGSSSSRNSTRSSSSKAAPNSTQAAAALAATVPAESKPSVADGSVFGWTLAVLFLLLYFVSRASRKKNEEYYLSRISHVEASAETFSAQLKQRSQQIGALEQQIQENAVSFSKEVALLQADNAKLEELSKDLTAEKNALQARLDRIYAFSAPSEGESIEDRNAALAAQTLEQQNRIQEQGEKISKLEGELQKHLQSEKTGIFYADDGLPIFYKSVSKKYGDYTVYLNEKSKIYHLDPQCAPKGATVSHLHRLPPNYWPCSKCASGSKGSGLYYHSN